MVQKIIFDDQPFIQPELMLFSSRYYIFNSLHSSEQSANTDATLVSGFITPRVLQVSWASNKFHFYSWGSQYKS
jgi:hypothetical protein